LLLDKLDEFKPSVGRESVDVGDVGLLAVRDIAGKSSGQKLHAETLLGSRTTQAVEDMHEGEFSGPSGRGIELQDAKSFFVFKVCGTVAFSKRRGLCLLVFRVPAGGKATGSIATTRIGSRREPRMADWDTRELAQTAATEDCAEVSDEGIRDVTSRWIVDESNGTHYAGYAQQPPRRTEGK
jgi:hypothetical protein